jgi:hypothetical protein
VTGGLTVGTRDGVTIEMAFSRKNVWFMFLKGHGEMGRRALKAVKKHDVHDGARFRAAGRSAFSHLQFDAEIKGAPLALKRARRSLDVSGRGGASFDPVIAFLDEHRGYDGAIIFTDGQAPAPTRLPFDFSYLPCASASNSSTALLRGLSRSSRWRITPFASST